MPSLALSGWRDTPSTLLVLSGEYPSPVLVLSGGAPVLSFSCLGVLPSPVLVLSKGSPLVLSSDTSLSYIGLARGTLPPAMGLVRGNPPPPERTRGYTWKGPETRWYPRPMANRHTNWKKTFPSCYVRRRQIYTVVMNFVWPESKSYLKEESSIHHSSLVLCNSLFVSNENYGHIMSDEKHQWKPIQL